MCIVSFDIPNDVLFARNLPKEQASGFVRSRFAVALYLEGGISLEYAAQIAALPVKEFSDLLKTVRPLKSEAGDAHDEKDMDWLLGELNKGVQSGQEGGWLSGEEMNARFERKRAEILAARRA